MSDPVTGQDEIKVGSVVALRHGGPLMTVNAIEASGVVKCAWFDSNDVMHFAAIAKDALRFPLVEPLPANSESRRVVSCRPL